MPKLITDYLRQSCSAPLPAEERSSWSTVETSSSSQRTKPDTQTSRTIHINEKKNHNRKQQKHSSAMSAWS